jgi:hypothetical protein
MATEMAFVKAQVCGASKEELVASGQSVRDKCDLCFDEGVNCRVENHRSIPLGKVSFIIMFADIFPFHNLPHV